MERSVILHLVLATFLIGSVCSDDNSPTVTVAQGTLVGHIYNTTYGSYYAFQGIPYAKPPVGDLRFKAPVPAEPWNGTFQAVQEGSTCVQVNTFTRAAVSGSEDCLFLNVYLPQLPDLDNPLPVMVWIHGGAFAMGSGNLEGQGPAFLLNEGVIYVSLNYRLSVLGFLSTEDEAAPGNAGMKDQVLALRWVRDNIAAFGGDPTKVTIFGESAGGASVSLQVVSPMSAGLFRAAIAESGSATNPWAIREKETARETAFLVGKTLGYTGNSSQELVDVLRAANLEDLIQATVVSIPESDKYRLVAATFDPVVEPDVQGEESFLRENPTNIFARGDFNDVAVLTGTNSGESIGFLAGAGMLDGSVPPEVIERNLTLVFKPDLRVCKSQPCGDEMIAKIKSFYFNNGSITSENLQNLVYMVTDLFFAEGTLYAVKMLSEHGTKPVYLYEFTYEGAFSSKWSSAGGSNYTGVPHADELAYVFDNGMEAAAGSTEALLRHEVPAMWANFAKTMDPTPGDAGNLPKWSPFSLSTTNYLDIGAELSMKNDFKKARMDFWAQLYGYN